eukprot:948966_1
MNSPLNGIQHESMIDQTQQQEQMQFEPMDVGIDWIESKGIAVSMAWRETSSSCGLNGTMIDSIVALITRKKPSDPNNDVEINNNADAAEMYTEQQISTTYNTSNRMRSIIEMNERDAPKDVCVHNSIRIDSLPYFSTIFKECCC